MNALRLSPVVLSAVLLAAHYLRAGNLALVLVCLAAPALLFVKRPWVPRAMQAGLALGAAIWIATAVEIVRWRMTVGAPWATAALILGAVALFTAGSAALFETRALRRRYGRQTAEAPGNGRPATSWPVSERELHGDRFG